MDIVYRQCHVSASGRSEGLSTPPYTEHAQAVDLLAYVRKPEPHKRINADLFRRGSWFLPASMIGADNIAIKTLRINRLLRNEAEGLEQVEICLLLNVLHLFGAS